MQSGTILTLSPTVWSSNNQCPRLFLPVDIVWNILNSSLPSHYQIIQGITRQRTGCTNIAQTNSHFSNLSLVNSTWTKSAQSALHSCIVITTPRSYTTWLNRDPTINIFQTKFLLLADEAPSTLGTWGWSSRSDSKDTFIRLINSVQNIRHLCLAWVSGLENLQLQNIPNLSSE